MEQASADIEMERASADIIKTSAFSCSLFSYSVREYELARTGLLADSLLGLLNDLDVQAVLECEEIQQKLFVSSLLKILTTEDSHSQLAWSCLHVLDLFCNATGNDVILQHLQKLTPFVSKIMLSAVTEERKVKVLKVLQALTYGIQIPRTESFVAPLIASLVAWSKSAKKNTIVQLSLSVLANLLHRNKAALYTLMQTVNLKDFMNEILRIRSNIFLKMEVFKLMFLLKDLTYEKPDEEEVIQFIKVSFGAVLETGSSGSKSHLQHCVSFFEDMVNRKEVNIESLSQPWFCDSVEKVVELLDSGLKREIDLDSAMLIFKFLRIFFEMGMLLTLRQKVMEQGVAWVNTHKRKATEAILIVHCIHMKNASQSLDLENNGLTGEQLKRVFLPLLEEPTCNNSDYVFITALLDFLSATLEVEEYKIVMKTSLKIETIEAFAASFPSNMNVWNNFSASESLVKMYISFLYFVFKIVSCCNSSWMKFYTCLFKERQVISILAIALLNGSCELKGKVFSLVCSVGFPGESLGLLAKSMADCGTGLNNTSSSANAESPNELFPDQSPNIAPLCIEVNNTLRRLKSLIHENKLQGILHTDILQLYELKEQIDSDYQRSLVVSLTNANEEKSLLQEKVFLANQITSELRQELYCLRPAFNDMREKYDSTLKLFEQHEQDICNRKNRFNEEVKSCQMTIQKLKETLETKENDGANAREQIKTLKEQIVGKENEVASLHEEMRCLHDETIAIREQIKDQIKEQDKLRAENANLAKELELVSSELKSKSKQAVQLEQEKILKDREIQELQRIRDTVFELTGGNKKF